MFRMKETFKLLGLALDDGKSQPPAVVTNILGVVFNMASVREAKLLYVMAKSTRKRNLNIIVDKAIEDDYLPPGLAASIVGKFGFVCSTLCGKVGRCATGALRARQYSSGYDTSLDARLATSLRLIKCFVNSAPPRQLSLTSVSTRPTLLYTDASDVPGRKEGRYIVGAVLDFPLLARLQYTYWVVPQEVVDRLIPKQTQMGQLEIFAGPVALDIWDDWLIDKQCLHFVDNDSATNSAWSKVTVHKWTHAP